MILPRRRGARIAVIAAIGLAAASAGAWLAVRHGAGAKDETAHPDPAQLAAALYAMNLPDADGRQFALASLRGHVTVVNFWATWCGPCVAEMPLLQKAQDDYARRGVRVIGIAADRPDAVRDFRREHAIRLPLLVAGLGGVELARIFGNVDGGLPYTVIVDGRGAVIARQTGPLDPDRVRKWLDDAS